MSSSKRVSSRTSKLAAVRLSCNKFYRSNQIGQRSSGKLVVVALVKRQC